MKPFKIKSKFYGKTDTIRRHGKCSRAKMYGRIKATKGINNLESSGNRALSHRILRRKLKVEDQRELATA
jgi:hypothetical protein